MSSLKHQILQWCPPALVTLARRVAPNATRTTLRIDAEKCQAQTPDGTFHFQDATSFEALFTAYFIEKSYEFKVSESVHTPLILDCGANIGVGCRYWKKLYPQSRVIAFEPDKDNFRLLTKNMDGLTGFEARPEAVWKENGSLTFNAVGKESGHLDVMESAGENSSGPTSHQVTIPTVRLRDFLDQKVDLLKIDIEGAELETLRDCRDRLHNVDRIFVEHHSFIGQPQRLAEFIEILESAGFRLNIQHDTHLKSRQPFMKRVEFNSKDGWLNIFGYRESY